MTCFRHRAEAGVYVEPVHNLAVFRGGCSAQRSGSFTPGKDPVPIVEDADFNLIFTYLLHSAESFLSS